MGPTANDVAPAADLAAKERKATTQRLVVGVVLVVVGIALAWLPFYNLGSTGQELLAELPIPEGIDSTEDSTFGPRAMFDNDLVLGERVYLGTTIANLERSFVDAGFGRSSFPEDLERDFDFSQECCGSWDAVFVDIKDELGADGSITVAVAPFDRDVQLMWPLALVFGVAIVGAGVVLTNGPARRFVREAAGT